MRVKLIAHTPNIIDVLYTSARTCYNAGSPINMFEKIGNIDKEKKLALIHKVLQSGHTSVLEHVSLLLQLKIRIELYLHKSVDTELVYRYLYKVKDMLTFQTVVLIILHHQM